MINLIKFKAGGIVRISLKTLISTAYQSIILITLCSIASIAIGQSRHFPAGTREVYIAQVAGIRSDLLSNIAPIIEKSISAGDYPGAVILIGHKGKIIYRGAFGNRRISPNTAPMRFDTIFDIASLTKVVATTPAIMQLVEQGKIDLDAPVARYWPEFSSHGKQYITIRELLTHTSGLPADVAIPSHKVNKQYAFEQICELQLHHQPGKEFLYSDVNFMVLAHLVEIISKENFDRYAQNHIFKPLRMTDTFFKPALKLRDRIAPTEYQNDTFRWGQVHDPIAYSLGGVSGNAGVFSSANDIGAYAQSLLDGGQLPALYQKDETHFLGPLAIAKMTTPQTPEAIKDTRGLGWDIDSRYSNRGVLFPVNSYGHTGWTGTSLWIDPVTQTYIVILTSRAHPAPAKNNQLVRDRRAIANILSASIVDITQASLSNTGKGELTRAYPASKG